MRPRFDRLAPHYWWLERLAFGDRLHWCRTALIPAVADAERVLVLGEGDGRFLAAFLAANRHASVDVIDASAAMLDLARGRVAAMPGADRVTYRVADARRLTLPPREYDLVVTNFFLDCFERRELEAVIDRIRPSLRPGGRWLVGDFAQPPGFWPGLAAQAALALMYACFKLETRIPAGRLVDAGPLMSSRGLVVVSEARRLGGFLVARVWEAISPGGPDAGVGRGHLGCRATPGY